MDIFDTQIFALNVCFTYFQLSNTYIIYTYLHLLHLDLLAHCLFF